MGRKYTCAESLGLRVLGLAAALSGDPRESALGRACSLSVCILSSWALGCFLSWWLPPCTHGCRVGAGRSWKEGVHGALGIGSL